jgi:hypothetical protein
MALHWTLTAASLHAELKPSLMHCATSGGAQSSSGLNPTMQREMRSATRGLNNVGARSQ